MKTIVLAACVALIAMSMSTLACWMANEDFNVTIPTENKDRCPIGSRENFEGWQTINSTNLSYTQIQLMKASPQEDVSTINLIVDTAAVLANKFNISANSANPIAISGKQGIITKGTYVLNGEQKTGGMIEVPLGKNNLLSIASTNAQELDYIADKMNVIEV
jgi:hypothetical protein